jgi:DNA-binding winged helix-turn-helix (wHTH) protein
MINSIEPDQSLTFRANEVKAIMDCLRAGDSCSIVGIGSVGKSNLLRFLQREDVSRQYLGEESAAYLFVYLDLNKLLKPSRWGLFELMLHQLLIALTVRSVDEAALKRIDELHQRATESHTRYVALRYLDRAVSIVCNQLELRLVFLVDEFVGLCRTMSPRGFAALRALRDDYKYHLMYVLATRLELRRLRTEPGEIEALEELVSSPTIWLGPYAEPDTLSTLQQLEARHKLKLDEKSIREALQASGGHPGLLREVYRVIRRQPADFSEAIAGDPAVSDECRRIWFSIPPHEQQVMINLAQATPIPPDQDHIVERLVQKGLAKKGHASDYHLFSPLLTAFVQQQNSVDETPIQMDPYRRSVWVNGYEVQGLTPLEYNLMAYLVKRRGQVCTRDELVQHLYPDEMSLKGTGVTDTRLDSLLKRLRKRVEPNPEEPQYILTVRGHGIRLVDDEAEK